MSFIGKAFAIVLFPLSLLIVLESIDIFSVNLVVDKTLVGAALMILLQALTLIFLHSSSGGIKFMNIFTAIVFIIPAVAVLLDALLPFTLPQYVPLILGVMMFVEALYALH